MADELTDEGQEAPVSDADRKAVSALSEDELVQEVARIYDLPPDVVRRTPPAKLRRDLFIADELGFDGQRKKRTGEN